MTSTRFAWMNGLPEYGERVLISNVRIKDVITYKVKGRWVFSVVSGITPTMIKVVDLICENTNLGVTLYINHEQNTTTKCLLNPTRRIFKIMNVSLL